MGLDPIRDFVRLHVERPSILYVQGRGKENIYSGSQIASLSFNFFPFSDLHRYSKWLSRSCRCSIKQSQGVPNIVHPLDCSDPLAFTLRPIHKKALKLRQTINLFKRHNTPRLAEQTTVIVAS